jgi:tetratricopeptide (TPR) repeat protein
VNAAWAVAILALLGPAPVFGDEAAVDPDTEISQRYFNEGRAFYAEHRYADALARFTAARRIRPVPALDYNIARCYDRMDRPIEAIAAYERYLAGEPSAADAAEIRARVATLRSRGADLVQAPASPPKRGHRYAAAGALLGAALGVAVVGTALVASVSPELNTIQKDWMAMPTGDLQGRALALEARADAGYVLWGVAGAAAVADVVLWALATRHREARNAAISAGALRWSF